MVGGRCDSRPCVDETGKSMMPLKHSTQSATADDKLLSALDGAESALSASEGARKHFASNLEWLKQRRKIWTNRKWRVGLIGITSSGKSTLINALLNEKVFKTRVRPSSNTLVICSCGNSRRAVVHYNDGRQESVERDLGVRLSHLADEVTNPKNTLGVREVELYHPSFLLGEGVELVDTPGLDAKGYDEHESLTLKTFLPTVDLVIFLTTAKASYDNLVRDYLNVVGEAGKPTIVVQNMIDSIEPKLGYDGVVAKDQNVVAQEHFSRLQRLIKQLAHQNQQETAIVQISAQWALEGKDKKSQLNRLISTVKRRLDSMAPELTHGRRQQLLSHLKDLVKAERDSQVPDVKASSAATAEKKLQAAEKTLKATIDALEKSLADLQLKIASEGQEFRNRAGRFARDDISLAEALKRDIFHWKREVPVKASVFLSDAYRNIRSVAEDMNLTSEDFAIPSPRDVPRETLDVPTTTQTKTRRVKQEGFLGKIKRLWPWGDAGYDNQSYTVTTLQLPEFIQRVTLIVQSERDWLQSASRELLNTTNTQVVPISNEVSRQKKSIDEQKASRVEATERLDAIKALSKVISDIEGVARPLAQSNSSDVPQNTFDNDQIDVSVLAPVVSLLKLAASATRQRHLALRNVCLQRAEQQYPGTAARALIWGWDSESIENILHRYWSDLEGLLAPEPGKIIQCDGASGAGMLGIALEEDQVTSPILATDTKRFLAKPTTLFLLLDPHQVGSTDNRLSRSALKQHFQRLGPVVVIAQSIRSLMHSPEVLVEGIQYLRTMTREAGLKPVAILANDDSSFNSVLLDTLWFEDDELNTVVSEKRLLHSLTSPWFSPQLDAAAVVRAWKRLAHIGAA